MADQEVRSPNSITNDMPHPRRVDALQQGGPFVDRSDSGAPSKPRADQSSPVPVQGMPVGVTQDRGRRG